MPTGQSFDSVLIVNSKYDFDRSNLTLPPRLYFDRFVSCIQI